MKVTLVKSVRRRAGRSGPVQVEIWRKEYETDTPPSRGDFVEPFPGTQGRVAHVISDGGTVTAVLESKVYNQQRPVMDFSKDWKLGS